MSMTQLRRTKPIFLVLSAVFLLIAVVFMVVLLINLHYGAAEKANAEVDAENSQYYEWETTTPLTNEDIIRIYGFHIGELGKVLDKNEIHYLQYDGFIRVIHNGSLYSISIKEIREQSSEDSSAAETFPKPKESTSLPTSPAPTRVFPTQSPTQRPATEPVASRSNNDNVKIDPEGSDKAPVYEQQPILEYNQSDDVVHPQNGGTAEDDIKLNPSAISVNKGDSFSISLIGAGSDIRWELSGDLVEIKDTSGNSCLLKAHNTAGTTVISASYHNKTYTCKVTIN
ncbi:MAG: hypothetical protein IJV48_06565 [Ruminococcus sp.]|nr:hypothetical protein [Ruminococcus sp.]